MRTFLRALICLLLAGASAHAQAVSTAQINGTVKDSGGLPLPGVTVTMTQTDTGLVRDAVTSETGAYVITNLPVGPYKLEASLQGFRTFAQTGIVLQVNSNPTLNVTLQVGQLAETITVEGTAPLVETRNPGIGQVITNEQVLELPFERTAAHTTRAVGWNGDARRRARIERAVDAAQLSVSAHLRRRRPCQRDELQPRRRQSQRPRMAASISRCHSPMRCRSSRSKPMRCRRNFGTITAAADPRIVQLALKYVF